MIEQCGHPLAYGRRCVKLKGHQEMTLFSGADDRKHAHTWQYGDAKIGTHNNHLVNFETGEVIGDYYEIEASRFRPKADKSREDALRVLRNHLPGFREAERDGWKGGTMAAHAPTIHATWYYSSGDRSFGVTDDGHDVVYDFSTGRVQRIYSINQKREAIEAAKEFGLTVAAKKYGIPKTTISAWIKRGSA